MRVQLLGVRGSTPAPGPDFVRYGGHTSCVAVTRRRRRPPDPRARRGHRAPVADRRCSTARRTTARSCSATCTGTTCRACRSSPPATATTSRVDLYVPAQDGRSGRDLLAQSFSPPSFPITPEGLRGPVGLPRPRPTARTRIEGFDVTAVDIEHKGGRTFGYRVDDERGSLAYLPDHAPAAGVSAELMRSARGRRRAPARRAVPRGRAPGRGRLRPRHRRGLGEARAGVRRRHAWCCSTTRRSAPTPRWTRSAAWAPGWPAACRWSWPARA